jgi:eukaryotic-like serine/threonine-protein kinase
MPPTVPRHPTATDLTAFALGKLTPAAADWIARHLDECSACRRVAESAPDDAFVGLLRQPGTQAAATPSDWGAETGGDLAAPDLAPDDVPPALRDHPRYRILRQIGHGGMGVVYQAEHRVMERLVAVKVISRALVDRPDAVERFHREVRAAAKLDHPNIVKAYDAEQAGDVHLLAMEFVEGRSLADVLGKKGPLPIAHACHYARQAALGLQHAFERSMVHRDIKPHNLMLTPKGVVKILDFGLAKVAREQGPTTGLTHENAVMGTPDYLAPEQATNTKTADVRADIYALGCTLFHLLAGRPPFVGDNPLSVIVMHVQDEPPALLPLRPDVPAELAAVVTRMLAKDPAARPQTPKEVAAALAPFAKTASHRYATSALPVEGQNTGATPVAHRRW